MPTLGKWWIGRVFVINVESGEIRLWERKSRLLHEISIKFQVLLIIIARCKLYCSIMNPSHKPKSKPECISVGIIGWKTVSNNTHPRVDAGSRNWTNDSSTFRTCVLTIVLLRILPSSANYSSELTVLHHHLPNSLLQVTWFWQMN